MIITIDGPAGAGKSTAARRLAAELGFEFLDTGAMYRAVTWAVIQRGLNPNEQKAIANLAATLTIQIQDRQIKVDGRDVSEAIRSSEVTRLVSPIADNPGVRKVLVELQRQIAVGRNFVCEGRDQGTIAFPDAICKFYLTASAESRATRRAKELAQRGQPADHSEILTQQNERDFRDANRPVGRLMQADDAIVVNTDNLTLDEVVAQLKALAITRMREVPEQLR